MRQILPKPGGAPRPLSVMIIAMAIYIRLHLKVAIMPKLKAHQQI